MFLICKLKVDKWILFTYLTVEWIRTNTYVHMSKSINDMNVLLISVQKIDKQKKQQQGIR